MSRCCPICLEDKDVERCERCDVATINKSRIAAKDPWIGKVFANKYNVESRLGSGGMGVVYSARQVDMDRLVALKVLSRRTAPEMNAIQRFYREMRATTRVEHPNTVRVYDFGHTEDGEVYLAMEHLSGRTLGQVVEQDGPLSLDRTLRIGLQIAKALGAAHSQGIVHRDLKPENIFLIDVFGEPDYVKVLDFGIARFAENDDGTGGATLTTTGLIVGTPAFMSPEQAMGTSTDGRSDVYSLGVVMYMMSTGQVPFKGATPYVLHSHVHMPPPPPSQVAPGVVPPSLERCILQLLNKEPDHRPQSADECIVLFEQCRTELGLTTGTTPSRPSTRVAARGVAAPVQNATVWEPTIAADAELVPPSPTPEPPRQKSKVGVWIALAATVVVVGAAVVWFVTQAPDSETQTPADVVSKNTAGAPASTKGAPAAVIEPSKTAATASPTIPETIPTPPSEPAEATAQPQVAEIPTPTTVDTPSQRTVRVSSTPAGATVVVNGETWGTTPLEKRVDPGITGTVEFRGEGLQTLTVPFDSDKQTDIAVALAPVAAVVGAPKVGQKRPSKPDDQPVAGAAANVQAPVVEPPVEHKPVIEKWGNEKKPTPQPPTESNPSTHEIQRWD